MNYNRYPEHQIRIFQEQNQLSRTSEVKQFINENIDNKEQKMSTSRLLKKKSKLKNQNWIRP